MIKGRNLVRVKSRSRKKRVTLLHADRYTGGVDTKTGKRLPNLQRKDFPCRKLGRAFSTDRRTVSLREYKGAVKRRGKRC